MLSRPLRPEVRHRDMSLVQRTILSKTTEIHNRLLSMAEKYFAIYTLRGNLTIERYFDQTKSFIIRCSKDDICITLDSVSAWMAFCVLHCMKQSKSEVISTKLRHSFPVVVKTTSSRWPQYGVHSKTSGDLASKGQLYRKLAKLKTRHVKRMSNVSK